MTLAADGDRTARRLTALEASLGLDRGAFKTILDEAVADQARLEELVEKHSCELPAWVELASTLDRRRTESLDAIACVIRETGELDDAVFGEVSKADCLEILRALQPEFEHALNLRAESARFLVTVAGTYREAGYSGSEIVDAAMRRLVRKLTGECGVSIENAMDYTAGLAQLCGILPVDAEDPRRALDAHLNSTRERFPDLTAIFPDRRRTDVEASDTGSFDAVANRVQQIALGLWPPVD